MNKLVKNWSYLLASDITQQIIGFVVIIILARKLSPEGYGQFNVILSVATIIAVFANFGMNPVIIREVSVNSKRTANLIKNIIIPIRSIVLILVVAVFLGYNKFIASPVYDWPLFILIIVLNLTLWDFSESIAFGHEVTKFSSILNIIFSITWLSIIFFIPDNYLNVKTVLVVYSLLHLTKAISYVFLIYKSFYFPTIKEIVEHSASRLKILKMSLPYVWLLGISTLGNQLPIQFLNSNSNLSEVGFYSVGNKLMVPIGIAVGTAFKTIFPFLTRLYASDKIDFLKKMKTGFNLILTFGTIIAVVLSLTSKYWLVLVFGTEYESSIVVFNFLVWYSIIAILDSLLSSGLSSSYKEKVLAILATLDIIIVIPLIYFGSFHGAHGLALAKLISGLFILAYHWVVFIKILKVEMKAKELLILMGLFILSLAICSYAIKVTLQILLILCVFSVAVLIKDSPVTSSLIFVKNTILNYWLKSKK